MDMEERKGHRCRICGNVSGNRPFVGREMMFGLRETFEYFECGACGCLQIAKIPADLGKYYPENYYSFQSPSPLKVRIKGPWLCDPFSGRQAVQRALNFLPGVRFMPEWMKRCSLDRHASVLEVGSGDGSRLMAMWQAGFRDLTGVDPFIRENVRYANGIEIFRKDIREVSRVYDFVMLHHAFEHMPDPLQTLKDLRRILKADGTILIRIPVASSYAWKTYGTDWLGLDPPRHLYLHTPKSLQVVVEQAGLRIVDSFCDGDISQFIGSEQYRRDIPWRDPRSYNENKRGSIFTRAQLRAFRSLTHRLNREKQGDAAAFFLRNMSDAVPSGS